jgi:hypothetical protein
VFCYYQAKVLEKQFKFPEELALYKDALHKAKQQHMFAHVLHDCRHAVESLYKVQASEDDLAETDRQHEGTDKTEDEATEEAKTVSDSGSFDVDRLLVESEGSEGSFDPYRIVAASESDDEFAGMDIDWDGKTLGNQATLCADVADDVHKLQAAILQLPADEEAAAAAWAADEEAAAAAWAEHVLEAENPLEAEKPSTEQHEATSKLQSVIRKK